MLYISSFLLKRMVHKGPLSRLMVGFVYGCESVKMISLYLYMTEEMENYLPLKQRQGIEIHKELSHFEEIICLHILTQSVNDTYTISLCHTHTHTQIQTLSLFLSLTLSLSRSLYVYLSIPSPYQNFILIKK